MCSGKTKILKTLNIYKNISQMIIFHYNKTTGLMRQLSCGKGVDFIISGPCFIRPPPTKDHLALKTLVNIPHNQFWL